MNGHTSVAEHLIQCGAKVNSMDKDGYMPIHYAGQNGRQDMVKLLITKGSDFTSTNNAGRTPLDLALLNEHTAVADFLSGAEVAGD